MNYATITGSGSYLPKSIVTNKELEQTLETSDTWMTERTGIFQRHISSATETASFMGEKAASAALTMANIESVDMIIVATTTPDAFFPSTACLIQKKLKLSNQCAAFDVSAACTGFNYALAIATQFLTVPTYHHILVIGTEVMSRLVDWQDKNTCILFGDGAGAVILSKSNKQGVIACPIQANGHHEQLLYANHLRAPDIGIIKMEGTTVFREAIKTMYQLIKQLLKEQNITLQDVDWLIPHQANLRILHTLAQQLHFPMDRVIITIGQHANTSSASIPLALDSAIRKNQIKTGQLLLMVSFGGGLTWGATLIRY